MSMISALQPGQGTFRTGRIAQGTDEKSHSAIPQEGALYYATLSAVAIKFSSLSFRLSGVVEENI